MNDDRNIFRRAGDIVRRHCVAFGPFHARVRAARGFGVAMKRADGPAPRQQMPGDFAANAAGRAENEGLALKSLGHGGNSVIGFAARLAWGRPLYRLSDAFWRTALVAANSGAITTRSGIPDGEIARLFDKTNRCHGCNRARRHNASRTAIHRENRGGRNASGS